MGVLFAFVVGWSLGARGGKQGYDDVVAAGREVLSSDEFATLCAAVRIHAGFTLHQLADWLQEARASGDEPEDIVSRVRRIVQPQARAS